MAESQRKFDALTHKLEYLKGTADKRASLGLLPLVQRYFGMDTADGKLEKHPAGVFGAGAILAHVAMVCREFKPTTDMLKSRRHKRQTNTGEDGKDGHGHAHDW